MRKLILVVIYLLLSPTLAYGAEHYIRAGAGGSSPCDTGWGAGQACSALPGTLVRGDTYYVATGSYGSITLPGVSGTTPIVIKHATIADHGSGENANVNWQDSYADQATFTKIGFASSSASYYTIDGVTGGGPGNWDGSVTPFGFKIQITGSGGQDRCILWNGSGTLTGITLRHIDMAGRGAGYAVDDDLVYLTSQYSNWYIGYCYMHDTSRTQILTRGGSGMTWEYCYVARDGTREHREAWSATDESDSIIRYNLFEDIFGTGVICNLNCDGCTASNWYIYGNAIYWTGDYSTILNTGVILVAWDGSQTIHADNWYVYNNVVVNGGSNIWYPQFVFQSPSGPVVARNNIWYNNTNGGGCTGCTLADNNTITNSPNPFALSSPWQAANLNNANTAWALVSDLAGVSLSAPYNTDMLGNTRGADGTFDRGAIEYGGGDTTPPTVTGVSLRGATVR